MENHSKTWGKNNEDSLLHDCVNSAGMAGDTHELGALETQQLCSKKLSQSGSFSS